VNSAPDIGSGRKVGIAEIQAGTEGYRRAGVLRNEPSDLIDDRWASLDRWEPFGRILPPVTARSAMCSYASQNVPVGETGLTAASRDQNTSDSETAVPV
jgi:hypothetical protein